jgi:PAS domain-containing protein
VSSSGPPAADLVPAELLDELADPLLWFKPPPATAGLVLAGANAAARQLMPLAVGQAAEEALAPLGAHLVRWFARQGTERTEALLEAGEAGTLRAVQWGGGELRLLRLQVLAAPLATRIADAGLHRRARGARPGRTFAQRAGAMVRPQPGGHAGVSTTPGLIVRSNAAFEVLVERVPVLLSDAAPNCRRCWPGTAADPARAGAGGAPVERQALVRLAGGRLRRLWRAPVAWPPGGERRVMAVVEDRSAEDERDLAQLEMGALMDTASVGVATYDPTRGWLAPLHSAQGWWRRGPPAGGGSGLLGIGRELVDPASLPEYERLQRALRHGERAEVRYAVRHPELGQRWLLTRVEPGVLAGGRATTSVVTLDVTEQESAQRRNEQLLRELTTILDGSTAGIAYLRGAAAGALQPPLRAHAGL